MLLRFSFTVLCGFVRVATMSMKKLQLVLTLLICSFVKKILCLCLTYVIVFTNHYSLETLTYFPWANLSKRGKVQ